MQSSLPTVPDALYLLLASEMIAREDDMPVLGACKWQRTPGCKTPRVWIAVLNLGCVSSNTLYSIHHQISCTSRVHETECCEFHYIRQTSKDEMLSSHSDAAAGSSGYLRIHAMLPTREHTCRKYVSAHENAAKLHIRYLASVHYCFFMHFGRIFVREFLHIGGEVLDETWSRG